jgi:hypothetical protein
MLISLPGYTPFRKAIILIGFGTGVAVGRNVGVDEALGIGRVVFVCVGNLIGRVGVEVAGIASVPQDVMKNIRKAKTNKVFFMRNPFCLENEKRQFITAS